MTDGSAREGFITKIEALEKELQEVRAQGDVFRQEAEIYKNLINMSQGSITITRAVDGVFRFVNDTFCKSTGYSRDEVLGRKSTDLNIFDDPSQRKRLAEMIRSQGRLNGVEVNYRAKDGHIIESLVSAAPIHFRGEYCIMLNTTGIANLKKVQRELQESEESYRSVMDLAPDVISITDIEDGRYMQINKAFSKITGYSAEETIGRTINDLNLYVHPGDRDQIIKIVREKGQVDSMEFDFRIKSGNVRHGLSSVRPIRFQGKSCIMFMTKDITDSIKAREALRQSEQTYRLLVENAYEGICITQNGILTFVNTRMEELTGYGAEKLFTVSFETLVHSDDRQEIVAWMKRIEEGKETELCTFRLINKKGETCWFELNAVPIEWEGHPAILHFLRDISLQKKMETQLIQAGKMEALGTLAGGIAHNFNNMLMGLQGHIALMLLEMDPGHPYSERLKQMESIIRDAAHLTRELLGLARGGKYEVKPSNINHLIDVTSDLFGRTKKEIRIRQSLQSDIWTVEVDRNQIEQVLLNLFVNASQAMPRGGDLLIDTQNVHLDSYYVQPYGVAPGRFVRISVADNGVGMDAETLKCVFDPFFTTKEIGKGTGLGLASAYGIIRNHGGIINVYSERDRGTTFTIYLPISEKAIPRETPLPDEIVAGTETILLVDDEEMILQVGKAILERVGYRVMTAASGDEAVSIYGQYHEQIDLVLLDMIMPDIGGGDIFDRLKAIDDRIVVLLSSGYSMNGQAKKIMDRGCRGFIQKPYSAVDLSRKLREILDAPLPETL